MANTHQISGRSAFLLNANAKSVGGNVLRRLIDMVPTGDLYLSRSFEDSKRYLRTILDKGYSQIYSGGGDGTLMNTISTLRQIADREPVSAFPHIGVLRLGTGNAVASILGARKPLLDAHHVLSGGRALERTLNMVRCEDGRLAPFAGIGLDGEVLNDYMDLKSASQGKISEALVRTAFGYVWAGLTRTAVRHMRKSQPIMRVTSKQAVTKVIYMNGVDTPIEIPAGSVLFEGPASLVCVGSIPCWGYGFQMFPHLKNRESAKMQLRIYASGVWPILANLYPSIWNGSYRGPQLFDFLVDQVTIQSEEPLPCQIAGDARGYRKEISFELAANSVRAVELDKNRLPYRSGIMGLLPAHALAR